MEKTVIEVSRLEKTYKGGIRALRGIDLRVASGSRFALLGPNGAGKSTLVRILCTLSKADSGSVKIDAVPLFGNMLRVRSRIGVALQDIQLDSDQTVAAHLTFQGRLFGLDGKRAAARARELMDRFGLAGSENRRAKELSGGNQRRLHTALALVHEPKILFLDEPTVGMDPEIRAGFWAEIGRLNREEGVTVFFTTQYLEDAERNAEELGVIEAGEVAYRGTVKEFAGIHAGDGASLEAGYLKFLKARRAARSTGTATEKEAAHV